MPHSLAMACYVVAGLTLTFLMVRGIVMVWALWYAPAVPPAKPGTTKVACVGDSITYGMLVRGRRRNCYPAQLQKLMGEQFSVRNFGANARAMQKSADLSYWKHPYFRASTDFNADIVLIMLGTNDSRKPNWKGVAPYLQDYRAMLDHYRGLPSRPRVFAITPPTEFVLKGRRDVKYGMIKSAVEEMTAGIRELARHLDVPVIDMNAATAAHPEHFAFDGVHANVGGAKFIADTVYAALR